MEWLWHAVEGEVQEVARNAVRALRGIRLCAEGHEEGRLTHLVLGQQRRTLKVWHSGHGDDFMCTTWLLCMCVMLH